MPMETMCVQLNLSPFRFHGWADVYWQEYAALPNEWRETSVAYLLLCRAIEIEFKAWHRQAGSSDGLIDRFRHDLMSSYRALPKRHQALSADWVSVLEQANSFYLSQRFENAEMCRAGIKPSASVDCAKLEALTQTVMEYGDRLNLKSW